MNILLHRPGPPLGDFISCIWLSEERRESPSRERVLPTGVLSLVFNLGEDRFDVYGPDERDPLAPLPGALVSGARSVPFAMALPAHGRALGVRFKPGRAVPFLGVSAGDLEGKLVPLDALWGGFAARLREQLQEATEAHARIRLIEAFLLTRAKDARPAHPRLTLALEAFEDLQLRSVTEVNARTGLSPKRLLALFREEVGMGPKAFWRLRRFRTALRSLKPGAPIRGAELALELGYCDQAHFNRDFRHFTGVSLGEFLARGLARPNHLPLAG